jgi:hypothetical protein
LATSIAGDGNITSKQRTKNGRPVKRKKSALFRHINMEMTPMQMQRKIQQGQTEDRETHLGNRSNQDETLTSAEPLPSSQQGKPERNYLRHLNWTTVIGVVSGALSTMWYLRLHVEGAPHTLLNMAIVVGAVFVGILCMIISARLVCCSDKPRLVLGQLVKVTVVIAGWSWIVFVGETIGQREHLQLLTNLLILHWLVLRSWK